MTDREFLKWIADRLVCVYGESDNTDFVVKLNQIADGAVVIAFDRYSSRADYEAAKESILFQFECLWREKFPGLYAQVEDAGGGVVKLWVERDSVNYPPIGAQVEVTWE